MKYREGEGVVSCLQVYDQHQDGFALRALVGRDAQMIAETGQTLTQGKLETVSFAVLVILFYGRECWQSLSTLKQGQRGHCVLPCFYIFLGCFIVKQSSRLQDAFDLKYCKYCMIPYM